MKIFVRRPIYMVLISILVIGVGSSCIPATAKSEIKAFVSVPPQRYLVEQIGGQHVNVEVMVKPGQDPHTFEPTPRKVLTLAEADVYYKIGIPFEEQLLAKVLGGKANLNVVDAAKGVERLNLDEEHGDEHDGEEEGHKHEGELDPHIWLSPVLLEIQARNVYESLVSLDPSHTEEYKANLDAFLNRVEDIHARITKVLLPYRGRSFYVFHPAFGYFASTYGLDQVAVEVEGKSPRPKQLANLIERAKEEDVKVIFVQPQFDTKSAQAVAASIGGVVIALDPLAEDMLANFEEIAQKLEEGLKN